MTSNEGHFEARKVAYRQSDKGMVISFAVHPNDMPAALASSPIGSCFMVAFAEIVPGTQEKAEGPEEDKPKRRFHELPFSQQAALKCNDQDFIRHLRVSTAEDAARVVRVACQVASRAELDTSPQAAARWQSLLSQYERDTGRVAEDRS